MEGSSALTGWLLQAADTVAEQRWTEGSKKLLRLEPKQEIAHPGMIGADESGAMIPVLVQMKFMRNSIML